ncbi:MAG: TetR/AcrR family transcriptional regulator [Micromonosporaceae bacterium]
MNARRQAILDAALAVFSESGVAAAAIGEIRARSGASIGSIYHHFGSKEGIAAALYAEAITDYQRGALAVLAAEPDAADGVRGLVRQFLEWVGGHPELARLMLSVERHELRALAAERVDPLNQEFVARVGGWLRGSGLGSLPADLFLPAVLGPARAYAGQWVAGRAETPLDQAATVLAELAWSGLGGPGAGG